MNKNNLESINARLIHIRTNILKLTRLEIHKRYKLPVDTLTSWELGRNKISDKSLEQLIAIYNKENLIIDKQWILTGAGLPPQVLFDLNRYFKSRVIEYTNNELNDDILILKEIEYFMSLSPNSIVTLISADDMLPLYSIGDYVGGRLLTISRIDSCINKNCIIKTVDGNTYIRRLIKNVTTSDSHYNLASLNPSTVLAEPVLFNVDIAYVAPIIWHRKYDK